MSILSKLFGKGGSAAATAKKDVEVYEGFRIMPDPEAEGGNYRIAATITKDGQSYRLLRADTFSDRDEAIRISLRKAKQVIDEQGERLFQ
ncbi:HlyU family transcriptional regulator [uncultured Roseobacter sp.]|uniref:HlyU family transcriptional regulator n=1 Tax=uncultured Roseobacter sp. TaxID=114847 RepID=UPI002637EC63|nr:HlyU family transcriptional regulator [uncultured Roseobacter sp.]